MFAIVPKELADCFPGVEEIPRVQYSDMSGNVYGCTNGEWKKLPPQTKRIVEVELEYCTIC